MVKKRTKPGRDMDAIKDPYTPSAGARPVVIAGRDPELNDFALMLDRLSGGRHAQSQVITGLRGVGKTVLLREFSRMAEERGWVHIEAEIGKSDNAFPALMSRLTRTALYEVSPSRKWLSRARSAASIIKAFSLTFAPDGSIGVSMGDVDPAEGKGDSGNLASDLGDVLVELGRAAKEHGRGVVFLVDEVQNLRREDMSALVMALHRCVQEALPIALVAAGLPTLPALIGDAESYAERLFRYPVIGSLDRAAAEQALTEPALDLGVSYQREALNLAVDYTEGYPFFIQEMGSFVWRTAKDSPITAAEVRRAIAPLEHELDEHFFAARSARTSETERSYLRAMASLPPGPKSASEVAHLLGYPSSAPVGSFWARLIDKGLIWSPSRGKVDFTVPHYDRFLRRLYPDWQPASSMEARQHRSARKPSE
jgi:hypothetical protein